MLTPRTAAASASRSSPACTGSLSRWRYGSGRIVIREPGGGSWPRRYFPVSHPPASGLNAWYSIPCSSHSGITSWSSPRSSSEYEFCTRDGVPRASHRRRSSAVTLLMPQAPIRPRSARVEKVANVSSTGVSGSGSCVR